MRPRSKSKLSQPHFHYHYHYYYPPHERQAFALAQPENLYASFFQEKDREEGREETPRQYYRMKTEGNLTHPSKSSSQNGMRMSESWVNKPEFPSYKSAERYNLTGIKSRSVVEEEVQQFQQESEELTDPDGIELKSRVTDAETYSYQSQLIAYYKTQLQKQSKQIDRLKMIEQECKYLRDSFYSHYTENCHDK